MSSSNRKQMAISFLQDAATGKVDAAYGKVASNFRHHNPHFPGDAESLKAGMAQAAAMFPNTTLEVQHVFEDGDLVAIHSRVHHAPNTLPIAAVHMFRFEGEEIAELWDVAMEAPQDSPNENGMF